MHEHEEGCNCLTCAQRDEVPLWFDPAWGEDREPHENDCS